VKDQDSRHWYYVNGVGTYDTIFAKKNLQQSKFSIGKKLEDFKFERGYAKDIDYWLKERLLRLRKKYRYIRLFFSGGKDSLIILQQAIKHNIFIDEIVYILDEIDFDFKLFPQYEGNIEVKFMAEDYLKIIAPQIPKTKITKLTYSEKHYYAKYSDPNWIRKDCLYDYLIHRPELSFWENINPKFKLLEDIEDRCDLIGGVIPHYWYNAEIEKWQFCYANTQMFNSMYDTGEDFFASDDCPELLNAFVEEMTINLEKQSIYPGKFSLGDARQRRSHSSIFDFNIINIEKEIPKKEYNEILKATEHPSWYFQDYKGFFLLINRLNPLKKSVDFYLNGTDWNLVLESEKVPALITKTFTIN